MTESTFSRQDGDLCFTEVIRQEYSNCCFSAGFVEGHPDDKLYFQAERDGVITTQLLLRPDEMAVIAWLASGVLWSHAISNLEGADAIPEHSDENLQPA